MWSRNKKNILLGLILLLLIIYLGFIRDFVFVALNQIIDQLYFNTDISYEISIYDTIASLGVRGVLNLKWGLTIVFMIVNYLLSFGILKLLLTDVKSPIRLLSWGYILLFLISAFLYLVGNLIGQSEIGYTLSRRFMGVLQSPVPLMVVAAVHMLFGNMSLSKTTDHTD